VLWCAIGMAVFLLTAMAHGVQRKDLLFIAMAPAAIATIFIGQNGFFTAALLIGGLSLMDRRPWFAGILFGLLTLKPQLGLLLPIMLLLTWRWRVIISATVTFATLAGITALLYGPDIWVGFVEKVIPQQRWLMDTVGGILYCMIPSTLMAARYIGLPLEVGWTLQWIATGAAIAAVMWTYWRRRDPVLSTAVLITATFVASPYTLTYDMVIFGWIVLLMRDRADNDRYDHHLGLAVWSLPITMLIAGAAWIPLGAIVLPIFLGRLLWRLAHEAPQTAADATMPMAAGPVAAR
jgi:hypothetical protein